MIQRDTWIKSINNTPPNSDQLSNAHTHTHTQTHHIKGRSLYFDIARAIGELQNVIRSTTTTTTNHILFTQNISIVDTMTMTVTMPFALK